MMASLVYFVDGQEVELEKMGLERLDDLTYKAFNGEEDIVNSPRYKEKLESFSKTGEFRIVYDGFDVLLKSTEYLGEFGFNPLSGKQYLSVLVGERKVEPTIGSLKETIVRTLANVDVVEEFYETFKDKMTSFETVMFCAGMLYESDELVFDGIKRIINNVTDNDDGYFSGRVFLDGLAKFESVKNKDEKHRLFSPVVFSKK